MIELVNGIQMCDFTKQTTGHQNLQCLERDKMIHVIPKVSDGVRKQCTYRVILLLVFVDATLWFVSVCSTQIISAVLHLSQNLDEILTFVLKWRKNNSTLPISTERFVNEAIKGIVHVHHKYSTISPIFYFFT